MDVKIISVEPPHPFSVFFKMWCGGGGQVKIVIQHFVDNFRVVKRTSKNERLVYALACLKIWTFTISAMTIQTNGSNSVNVNYSKNP